MNRFSYIRANAVPEAVLAATRAGARVIAGGTNLIDLIKYDVEKPSQLVDITRIPGLDSIEQTPSGGLRIGAMVRNATLAYDAQVAELYPLLSLAILSGATPQLRTTRCPVRIDGDLLTSPLAAPRIGEHNQTIADEFGL